MLAAPISRFYCVSSFDSFLIGFQPELSKGNTAFFSICYFHFFFFQLQEHELEMILFQDVRDQKMAAHLGGLQPEEDPGLLFDVDLVHPFGVVGLQEGEADLLEGGMNTIILHDND